MNKAVSCAQGELALVGANLPFPCQLKQAAPRKESLWDLMGVFGPAEAEAKVVARDAKAQQLIDAVASGKTMPAGSRETDPWITGRFDPVMKQMFQQVLEAAQQRPETATVEVLPEGNEELEGKLGYYDKPSKSVTLKELNPLYSQQNRYTSLVPTARPYQEVLTHELLHFLIEHMRPELFQQGFSQGFKRFFGKDTPQQVFRLSPEKERAWSDAVIQGKLTSEQLETWNKYRNITDWLPEEMLRPASAHHRFINYLLGDLHGSLVGPKGRSLIPPEQRDYFPPLNPRAVPYYSPLTRDLWIELLQRLLHDPQLLQRTLVPLQSSPGGP